MRCTLDYQTKDDLRNCRLEREGEDLWWIAADESERVGNLVRCFPTSSPDSWISVRAEDGREMALIRRLGDLDPDSRATLGPLLHEKYHIPVITLIHSIEGSASGKLIRVQTVEGPDSLDINDETDVDFSGYPSVLFTDRTKRRKYVIEDAGNLDKQSRDLIRRHLRTPGRGRGRHFR